jgi:phosphohistidine phosphatase
MDIYLIQHGQAESKDRDPARSLTPSGRSEAIRTATRVAELGLEVGAVWHSGKLRAQETAVIFAESLRPTRGVFEREGLAPLDDPGITAREIGELETPVVLVGHLPHLSRLASLLVTGDADCEIVAFRNAGIVCLGREDHSWRVKWIIAPDKV